MGHAGYQRAIYANAVNRPAYAGSIAVEGVPVSPREGVQAIQADTARIREVREELETLEFVVCRGCGCEKVAGEDCDNCEDTRGRETDLDMGGYYD